MEYVPEAATPWHIVSLVLNILIPGSGTILSTGPSPSASSSSFS